MPKNYNKYYEVFIGGGAVLFDLQPYQAVISDSNKELSNCYTIIRDQPDELIKQLIEHSNSNNQDYFYKIRELDRRKKEYNKLSQVERASRIIYLNKTCFNGLFRVNSQGQFNVPFGKYKNPDIVNSAMIKAISKYLNENNIEILNADFEEALSTATKNNFVYLDPPYHPLSNTASFTGYDVNGFGVEEQERLKRVVDELTQKGCKVLVSNSAHDFIKELYADYNVISVSAIRAINSKGHKRGKVEEVLIKNYD